MVCLQRHSGWAIPSTNLVECREIKLSGQSSFTFQQETLGCCPSAVAAGAAATADDAMAGDENRERVGGVGIGGSAGGGRDAEAARLCCVSDGVAAGDKLQLLPDTPLKIGADEEQGNAELLPLACGVFLQLRGGLLQGGAAGVRLHGGTQSTLQAEFVLCMVFAGHPVA